MRTCGNCGSTDHDKRTCPETKKNGAAKGAPAGKAEPVARARFDLGAETADQLVTLREATVDELVKLRAAVKAELERRKEEAEAQLEKLTEVVG